MQAAGAFFCAIISVKKRSELRYPVQEVRNLLLFCFSFYWEVNLFHRCHHVGTRTDVSIAKTGQRFRHAARRRKQQETNHESVQNAAQQWLYAATQSHKTAERWRKRQKRDPGSHGAFQIRVPLTAPVLRNRSLLRIMLRSLRSSRGTYIKALEIYV